jgi:hypothetical protein
VAGADGNFALDMSQAPIAGVVAPPHRLDNRSAPNKLESHHSFEAIGTLAVLIGYG